MISMDNMDIELFVGTKLEYWNQIDTVWLPIKHTVVYKICLRTFLTRDMHVFRMIMNKT